ncbi:TonB-dependent receptor [Maribellus sediminis]|uniref:TonB-dependent receptor n=1 Tax=Maribellus sediminis TaxID=2696285 RepID=UPI0014302B50|nr:TonB-dependent receptor [Maribellus sediminis]
MKIFLSGILFLFFSGIITAQNKVSFQVNGESGESLIGASVIIEGTSTGTVTDTEGLAMFSNLPDGKMTFVISFVGYEEKEIDLSFPADNNKVIEVELEAGEELEEVIITTTRSSRSIQDIPTRIEAITGEELGEKAAMNSSNIGMLLRETTGVQMQQTSLSSGNMNIRIQGLDGRYTQILKDGMPLYGGFAGGLSIMQIPPLDLRQVELIKGSNSTLYGGGAIAGLVNLVSIQPEDEPVLDVMVNQTSALGSTGNLFYAQKYGKVGLSVYGSGSFQVPYDPDNDGFSNMPEAQTFGFNPKLYFYFNPNTELSFGFNSTIDKRTGGDMEVIKGNADAEHVFFEENKSERYSTQLNFLNSTDNRTISFKNSISWFDRKLTIPDYRFNGHQVSGFSEAMYNLHRNKKSEWQFGLNHYLEQFTEEHTDTTTARDYTHNTFGGFIQNTTDFSEKLVLEAGLRTDYNADYGTFVLPRFTLLYKANSKLSTRVGGAMGYKLPTIFTEDAEILYFRGIQALSDQVDAETSLGVNFDVNYKTALGEKMTFSINQLFYVTQLKNALVLREDNASDLAYFESADGNILSSGFETNAKLSYNDFKLYINYAFINTKLKYDNINRQKPLTPKHNAGFVLMYEIEEKWSAGYELYYTGKQYDNVYHTKTDYWIMGAMLMRMFENFSVFINFENFTNTNQSKFEPLVLPPYNSPTFTDIWAPTDGFVFNGGVKISIL